MQNKQLILDVIQAFMQGRINDFHAAMEKIETELGQEELNRVNELLAIFPKDYDCCTDVIYQLLTTVMKLKELGLEFYPGQQGDLHNLIRDTKVEDHWK